MINEFLQNLKSQICQTLLDFNVTLSVEDVVLEVPKDKSHGDFSTNVCMRLAKTLRKAPTAIAADLKAQLDLQLEQLNLEKIEVAGAGFLNFFINTDYLLKVINQILANNNYGSSKCGNNIKINIEFVSANPTGFLHVGHGRGAAYGDSLANIYKKCGYEVTKEHYVNDAGNQITNMALSVYERYKELYNRPFALLDDYYHGKEIIGIAEKIKELYQDKYLDNFDLAFFKEFGTQILLNNLKLDLERFNVYFDVWFSEKSLYENNKVQEVIQTLDQLGYTYILDNAKYLKTSLFGDEKDRVIIKSDGSYTYFLPDIAYHNNKLSRGYDHLIDVLGADHHGYVDRLKAAVSMLGADSDMIDVELLQMVRVLEDGQEVKMSKRSGKAITLVDLMDDVGTDALRYFYSAKALSSHMDLDLNIMKAKSNDNPVFYAQYAYARVASVIRKFEEKGYQFREVQEFHNVDKLKIKDICLMLLKYPQVILDAKEKRLVHKITQYVDELAYQLHSFYNDEKIITDNIEETLEKLTILKALQWVLKDALALLGIKVYEQM